MIRKLGPEWESARSRAPRPADFEAGGHHRHRRNHGQQQEQDLDVWTMGLPGHIMARHQPKSRDPAADRAQPKHRSPALHPAAAAGEDDEQQSEHAEAERRPQYIDRTPALVISAATGKCASRNALGKTSIVPWSRIAMSTLPRVLLKTQVKMNVTAIDAGRSTESRHSSALP